METVKLKMNKSQAGAIDGIHVELFKKDQVYDIPEDLAKVFVDNKWAAPFVEEPIELKGVGPAPKNKAIQEPVKNKTDEPKKDKKTGKDKK